MHNSGKRVLLRSGGGVLPPVTVHIRTRRETATQLCGTVGRNSGLKAMNLSHLDERTSFSKHAICAASIFIPSLAA